MVVVSRIFVPDCTTKLERREAPPSEGPSSVRICCTLLSREYSSLRLAGGDRAVPDQKDEDAMTGEQTFFVYDSSTFLRYEDTRRAVQGMLASMTLLRGLDVSSDNWLSHTALEGVPRSMQMWARQDDDLGLTGGHYHFYVEMKMEVRFVFNEPKAVVRACAENIMQTVAPGCTDDRCSICLEGFFNSKGIEIGSSGALSALNLPCLHSFHTRCITVWLFKGHTCPVCRHDLRGLVSVPWASQEQLAVKN